MKSMCQVARRNSPSVAERRPTSSWSETTSRIASSSIALSSSAPIRSLAKSSRALSRAGGRSRLPTWSARYGGVSRAAIAEHRIVRHMLVGHVAFAFAPLQLAPAVVAAVMYRLRTRHVATPASRQWCFYGGLALMAAALVSPLAHLSDELFLAHMLEHLLLADL